MHDQGQASTEYVAILLVVGVLLAVSAVAVAVPGVGERSRRRSDRPVHRRRRRVPHSDAVAAGLAPCVTSERSKRQDTTVDLAVVRLGGHGEWQIALRSDGQAIVTRLEENELAGRSASG